MAQLGCVFDAGPVPRTPEQVMAPGPGNQAPRALRRWYAADIAAARRDDPRDLRRGRAARPGHARTWIVLVDGTATRSR